MTTELEAVDDSEIGEYQIYGAPGCGKTTTLTRNIKNAVQARGSANVMVASFTTAAASELAGRDLPINKEQVATLHAHGYRSIGKPKLLEADKVLIDEWNKRFPHWKMLKQSANADNPHDDGLADEASEGAAMLSKYNLMRAKRSELWYSSQVKSFAEAWERFKADTNSIDYTDMIAMPLERVPYAPGSPSIIFIDEAQDLTPLEWALVRKWSAFAEKIIASGDDDQCIYEFKGASAAAFFDAGVPEANKRILTQSHRMPHRVHEVANKWIHKVTNRQEKVYQPRTENGQPVLGDIRWLADANFNRCDKLLKDMEYYLRQGKSVMILASCAYMLNNVKTALRSAGLPFENKYRRKRGDWNPLYQGKSTAALLGYLAPMLHGWKVENNQESWQRMIDVKLWTKEELDAWLSVMNVSTFLRRGCGKQIEEMEDAPTSHDLARMLDDPQEYIDMVNGNLGWFKGHLSKANRTKFEYLCTIVQKHNAQALKMQPPIQIGTIHSVKGGEADVVYLMPDLSRQAFDNWKLPEIRDAVIRQFYVGMTRCRDTLVLLSPGSNYYIKGLNKFIME